MKVEMRPTNTIKVGDRVRADLGDLDELVESLRERGLINPITITKDGTLIAGARRLAAAQQLEWVQVPVHVWRSNAIEEILAVEIEENTCRAQLTLAEAKQAWQRYRELILEQRQADSNDNKPMLGARQIDQLAAEAVGYGLTTIEAVDRVARAAEDETQPAEVREVAQAEYEKLRTTTTGAQPAYEAVRAAKNRAAALQRFREERRAKTRAAMVPGQTLRSDEPKPPPKRFEWTGRLWEAVSKAAGPISLENLTEQLASEPIQDVDVKADDLTRMADLLQAQIRHRQELRKLLLNIKKGRS